MSRMKLIGCSPCFIKAYVPKSTAQYTILSRKLNTLLRDFKAHFGNHAAADQGKVVTTHDLTENINQNRTTFPLQQQFCSKSSSIMNALFETEIYQPPATIPCGSGH